MNKPKNCKRIVFLIGSMGRGGAERVISILANDYVNRGWDVDILMLLDNRCDYILDNKIKVKSLWIDGKSRMQQLPRWLSLIRRYVIENKPDRIVSFVARINIITILACVGLKQNIIISERNDPSADGRSIFVKLATHLLYPLAKCVVFQTKWAQSCFLNIIKKRSVIIPNPVNVSIKSTQDKDKKIVAVGRLVEQKNYSMLIHAFKKLHERYPEYKLCIFGEGRQRSELTRLIDELKLSGSVFLPGNITNVHEKIADAEMFVLSSKYEGLSNALLEAMMMGLPCISTDCAGSNEIIIDGKNGFLVPIGSIDKLAEAIERLILDKELAHRLGKNARISMEEFKGSKVLKKWRTAIESSSSYNECAVQ